MAQLLQWLLFACWPSQTLQHGFKHAPCAFLTGSDTLFCPCFPPPGWQAGTWQLSASSARSALVPQGSDWAPCLSSLLNRKPSSLFSSNHSLWANDGSSPHTQAISLKPVLLPMHPAGLLKRLQRQHRNGSHVLPSFCVFIKTTTFNPSHQLPSCHNLAATPCSEPLHL